MKLTIRLNGTNFDLNLKKNEHLSNFHISTFSDLKSENITKIRSKNRLDNGCFYYGFIENVADSQVALSTCEGLVGRFFFLKN